MKLEIHETAWPWRGALERRPETRYLVLHHAAARRCSAADVDRWHREKGWSGIGYHYFVRKDGSVWRGRPEQTVGAHTYGYNRVSLGVCFEGDYETEREMPAMQKEAGRALLARLRGRYPGARVAGHREFLATDCPGRYFPLEEFRRAAAGTDAPVTAERKEGCEVKLPVLRQGSRGDAVRALQLLLSGRACDCGAADGAFGPRTDAAVRRFQRARGLTVDGVAGVRTWGALLGV